MRLDPREYAGIILGLAIIAAGIILGASQALGHYAAEVGR